MPKVYLLPCAGYDRPGGAITRMVAEKLASSNKEMIIGSAASLSTERPGEVRDLLSSKTVILDGCSLHCATKLAESKGAKSVKSIEVTEHIASSDSEEQKVDAICLLVEEAIREMAVDSKEPTRPRAEISDSGELTAQIDKFKLRVREGYYYSDNDFWAKVEGDKIRVGASDLLQQMTSDIYYVEIDEIGKTVELGDEAGRIESTKTAIEIISPVSGVIVEHNERLVDSPELVNESPYDEGWLYMMEPLDLSELDLLKTAGEYLEHASERAHEELGKKATE